MVAPRRHPWKLPPPNTVSDGEGTIRLALGGAVGKTTKTRADETTITAEDDEKKVESLYAVLFKDAEVSTEDGEDNTADLFFKAINVTDSIYQTDSVRFKVSSGDYQICFVANPSAGLFDGLTAGSSSVANFKALVETKAPDTKPGMLMTSDFHKATVTTNDSININTVTLERTMARIDIVNKADGITIDSVKLANRATQSILISDGATTDYAAFKDTTYKDVSLAGKADGTAAYKARIYSYEQYGEEEKAPSMVVYYSIGEKKYTHTIKFVTKGENDAETQINFKRNNLYTVNITNAQGKLTFTLTVADWNKGTTFEVTNSELIAWFDTPDYSNVAVGDIMISNGALVKASEMTASLQAAAIGVVAYVYPSTTRTDAGTHGLVMALKNAATGITWSTTETLAQSEYSYTSLNAAYNGANGNVITNAALTNSSLDLTKFLAFGAVKTFRESNSVPKVDGITEWYLPSMVEWIDIMSTSGIGGVDVSKVISTTGVGTEVYGSTPTSTEVCSRINACLEKVGSGNYDAFAVDDSRYWSSSEYENNKAYYVRINGSGVQFGWGWKVTGAGTRKVRCVLAF